MFAIVENILTEALSRRALKSISITVLFLLSSVAGSVLIGSARAAPNPAASLAATPLSGAEANWATPTGNSFNQDYNPQNIINSSNAQFLGLSWLFPLPTRPTALLSVGGFGGQGVDTAPLIINGTIYFVTQFDQVFALNAANGNVLWTDQIPILPNSTAGKGTGNLSLHFHDGDLQYTTKLFSNTPTIWIAASDLRDYAINAVTGKYEMNFSIFDGVKTIDGNNPGALYGSFQTNLLVDESKGILVSSEQSGSSPDTGRCFYRGWNVNVNPPTLMWTAFCTPPQPGGNLPVDPTWTIKQVNSMQHAWIFKGYGRDVPGGYGGPEGAIDLKALSPGQLNSSLYDDWGYTTQTPECKAWTGGGSSGSTAAGWGAPWILGTGATAGMAFVNTNNRDPYNSPCTLGPDLWSAAVLALNDTNGNWIWGFQTVAHEVWDWDCSWWQAMGTETIGGVSTQVIWKTCKAGYLYELNAQTGALIWSWTPPTNYLARCHFCYPLDPLNKTEMNWAFFNPSLKPTLMYPGPGAEFEDESAYSPPLNYIFLAAQNNPSLAYYVGPNASNYKTNSGMAFVSPNGAVGGRPNPLVNLTVFAVDATNAKIIWTYFTANQGYRGGLTTSGNLVFLTLSSGDVVMLNAKTGALVKDLFIGGPLNVLPSIGATASGQMEVIFPITAGIVSWGTAVPGDIVALQLQNIQASTVVTSTASAQTVTQTTTVATTITAGTSGLDPNVTYGIAGVAAIFIIATGYFAMRGRKPRP